MESELDPIVDNWYAHLDKGQQFKVVAVDTEAELIELQHFDGDIEEVTLSQWREMQIELSEEPEDWSGPLDIGEIDDLGTEITDTGSEVWSEPLSEYPNSQPGAAQARNKAALEDWAEGRPQEQSLEDEV